MNHQKYKALLALAIVLSGVGLHAAPGTPPPPPTPPGENLPIPGLIYAIIAAISYGVFKKFNNLKK